MNSQNLSRFSGFGAKAIWMQQTKKLPATGIVKVLALLKQI
jgi:hypothetical protein